MIHKDAVIGTNVKFGENVVVHANAVIGNNCVISHHSIIGDTDLMGFHGGLGSPTFIGRNSFIRPFSIISHGVNISSHFQGGDKLLIRTGSKIGKNCSIGTMCDLQGNLTIGDNTRLHSNIFVGEKTTIENDVWVFPSVVFTNDPAPPMGILKGSIVRRFAQVGTGSIILPGIEMGESCFIGAGSLVNRDVGAERIAFGSPASDRGSVREMRDSNGNLYLPWQEYQK
tara:strand:+ start:97715 stop:98395 length:681 start_codon:yes stop_codon:yes gene_type:complete